MSEIFERVVAETVINGMSDESKDAIIQKYLDDYVFTRSFRNDVAEIIQTRLKSRVKSMLDDTVHDPKIEKCVGEIMQAELDDLGWLKRQIHESFLKRAARKFVGW